LSLGSSASSLLVDTSSGQPSQGGHLFSVAKARLQIAAFGCSRQTFWKLVLPPQRTAYTRCNQRERGDEPEAGKPVVA